jgi:hypothetical protein
MSIERSIAVSVKLLDKMDGECYTYQTCSINGMGGLRGFVPGKEVIVQIISSIPSHPIRVPQREAI